jgi:hypothetical protein
MLPAFQQWSKEDFLEIKPARQLSFENPYVMHIGAGLCFRRSVGERTHELLGCTAATNGLLQISEAFDKEQRRDVRHVKVVEQNRVVDVEAFERGFVDNDYRTLRHTRRLCVVSDRVKGRFVGAAIRCIVSAKWKIILLTRFPPN